MLYYRKPQLLFASPPAGSSYLLDLFPGAAGAYSLRKLKSSAAHPFRARRSSNNDEVDIDFDGAEADYTGLLAWGSGSSIYIPNWYDQSGNAVNMPQSTNSAQPRLVNAGTLDTENGKPALIFDNSDDHFNGGDVLDPAGAFNLFLVGKNTDGGLGTFYAKSDPDGGVQNKIAMFINFGSMYWRLIDNTGQDIIEATASNSQLLAEQWYVPGSTDAHKAYRNNTLINSLTWSGGTLGATTFDFLIGAHNDSGGTGILAGSYLNGSMQELIMYHADKSADRASITSNINDFYAVF